MSIEKLDRKFELSCDDCGRCHFGFETMQEAYDYGKEMGWSVVLNGKGPDTCEECDEHRSEG